MATHSIHWLDLLLNPRPGMSHDSLDMVQGQSKPPWQTRATSQDEESKAFEDVLKHHHDRLAVLVRRLLGWPSGSEVNDVLQDAYLAAWTKRHTYRGQGERSAWIHRIAVHQARNHVRAHRRRNRLMALFGRSSANRFCETPHTASSKPAPDELVRQAMAQLAHRDREILVLRYLEDRAIDDLAQVLKLTRAAVDARLSRARARLRTILGNQNPTDATTESEPSS